MRRFSGGSPDRDVPDRLGRRSVTRYAPWTCDRGRRARETVSRRPAAGRHAAGPVDARRVSPARGLLRRERIVLRRRPHQRGRERDGDERARTSSSGRATAAAARGPSPKATPAAPQTLEAALDRFYKYLEATPRQSGEGRERWQRARRLVEDLRAMGDVGAQALMSVLGGGTESDERRAAARLLGQLQVPQSLGMLKDVIEREDERTAPARRRLRRPQKDARVPVPVMERVLANPNEDRFVRLSAAYGWRRPGSPRRGRARPGCTVESTADGRGRDMAFRALPALDEGCLPCAQ